jgi:hypothetical protein
MCECAFRVHVSREGVLLGGRAGDDQVPILSISEKISDLRLELQPFMHKKS